MELKQAIYNRTSVRVFQEKPVPKEIIEELVLAGQQAPSACNKQAWRFVAVSDKAKRERMVKKAGSHPLTARAPLAMVVLYQKHITENKQSHIQSASAAIENMLLLAHSLGLGGCWSTGIGSTEVLKKILGVPDNFLVVAIVVFGWPAESPKKPFRKELSEILSFEKFNFKELGFPFSYLPQDWTFEQIVDFRARSVRAASPREDQFNMGRPKENQREIDFALASLKESDEILEILPFAGSHTAKLLKKKRLPNFQVFELSDENAYFSRKKVEASGVEVSQFWQIKSALALQLPYDKEQFDVVVCFQKLEGLPDLKILQEINRVLRPGGKLLVSFKNLFSLYGFWFYLKKIKFNKKPIWNYGPAMPLNYFRFKKELARTGFKIEKELGITPFFLVGSKTLKPFTFLSRLVILKAVKK